MIDVTHRISAVARTVGKRTLAAGEARVVTVRVPSPAIASRALSIRLVQTWLSSPGLASMAGRSAA